MKEIFKKDEEEEKEAKGPAEVVGFFRLVYERNNSISRINDYF